MATILLKTVNGGAVIQNSMYEKDLTVKGTLRDLSQSEIGEIELNYEFEIPKYMDQGIDITKTPLWQYLNRR